MKKFYKAFLLIFAVIISSSLFFACGDKEDPIVNPSIDLKEGHFLKTSQKLEDVVIKLGKNDTAGKISWTEPSMTIKIGVNEYEWKFTPNDSRFNSITGKIELTGYKVINFVGIEPIYTTKNGEDKKSFLLDKINELYGEDYDANILESYTNEVIENGKYSIPVKLTTKPFRYIDVIGEMWTEFTPNIELTIGKELTSQNLKIENGSWASKTYNGSSQAPATISMVDNDNTLIEGENGDYTVSWKYKKPLSDDYEEYTLDADESKNFVNAGSYNMIVSGVNNYFGEISKQYIITQANLAEKKIENIANVDFNGKTQRPTVNIKGFKEDSYLTENTDFTLKFEYKPLNADDSSYVDLDTNTNNFVLPGVYKVVATGINNFVGETSSAIYTINLAQIPTISKISDTTYTGASQQPNIIIGELTEDKDYTISWEYKGIDDIDDNYVTLDTNKNNFVDAGVYKVTATGEGNYIGSVSETYTINKKEIPSINSFANSEYTGKSQKPLVSTDGLVLDVDYSISWEYKMIDESDSEYTSLNISENNFVNAGVYKVIATGIGNYTGSVSQTYTINKKVISSISSIADTIYNGESQQSNVLLEGLVKDVDYNLVWEYKKIGELDSEYTSLNISENNFVNAGVYKVIATGIGNYTGSASETYTINKKEIANLNAIADVTYDGNSYQPILELNGLTASDYDLSYNYKKLNEDDTAFVELNLQENNFVNAGVYKVTVTGKGNYRGEVCRTFRINNATNELTTFVVRNWAYGEEPIDVEAIAKLGDATIKFYSDSNCNTEIKKPTSTTDAGTYYVKVFVIAENYDDFESEVKELVISKASATITSFDGLKQANENNNYVDIILNDNISITENLTFNKKVTINSNYTLTISSGKTVFNDEIIVDGNLVVNSKASAEFCDNANFSTNSITNNGTLKINVSTKEALEKAVKVASLVVLKNDLYSNSNEIINIATVAGINKSIKCTLDLNGYSLTNYSLLVSNKNNPLSINLSIINQTGESSSVIVSGENSYALKITGDSSVEVNLSNVSVESNDGPALVTEKGESGAIITANLCSFTSSKTNTALLLLANYTYSLTNSTIVGGNAITIFAGSLKLNNPTITANGETSSSILFTGESGNVTGDAILMLVCQDYGDYLRVSITGDSTNINGNAYYARCVANLDDVIEYMAELNFADMEYEDEVTYIISIDERICALTKG